MPPIEPIDIERLAPILIDVKADDGRHILLGDDDGNHRLWLTGDGSSPGGAFLLPSDRDFGARLHSLQRFRRRLDGHRAGPRLRSLQLSLTQRARLTLQLRALDGALAKATRRELAAVLLDAEARSIPAIEWKTTALRKQINRIVARGVALMTGGYLGLLRGDSQRAERFHRR